MKNKFAVALVAILSLSVLLTGCLTEIEETVTVTFDVAGGTPAPGAVELPRGGTLGDQFPTQPTNGNQIFLGWFNGLDQYTADAVINADITLTAKWKVPDVVAGTDTWTVTFSSPDAFPASEQILVKKGNALGPLFPIDPRQKGKKFEGWESEPSVAFDKTIPVTGDITVTATWSAKTLFTVTLKVPTAHQAVNPGINNKEIKVFDGDALNEWQDDTGKYPFPTTLACADDPNPNQFYRFERWSNDGTANGIIYNERSIIEANVTLTAYYVFNFHPKTFEVDLATLNLTTNAMQGTITTTSVRTPLATNSNYNAATGTVTATFNANPSFIYFHTPKALVDLIGGTSAPNTTTSASVANGTAFRFEIDADLKLADGTIVNGNDQYVMNVMLANLANNDNWNATDNNTYTLDTINGGGETGAEGQLCPVMGTITNFAQTDTGL